MKRSILCCAFALLALNGLLAADKPSFTKKPEVTPDRDAAKITFAVSKETDVTVLVKDRDGNVVRHLAAGVLGRFAPAPLTANSLEQTVAWDGKDNDGKAVPEGRYKVHVTLGTIPKFDRNLGQDRQWLGNINALAVGEKGEVYVYCNRGIVVLDRNGKYLRQIVPAPASLSSNLLAGCEPVALADGSTFLTKLPPLPGAQIGSMAIAPNGDLLLPGPARHARCLVRIGPDGSVRKGAYDKMLTKFSDDGYLYLACSPDGKVVYAAGAEAGYRGDDARKVSYRQSVYRLLLDTDGPAENFLGDDENSGGPGFSVDTPKGLAVDRQGRLYVCNYGRGDVAVYTPGAGLIKTLPVKHPQQVAVHPENGKVYVLAGKEEGRSKYGYDYPPVMREAILYRLSADGKVETEYKFEPAFLKTRKEGTFPEFKLRMAADFSKRKPVVWVGTAYPGGSFSKYMLLRIEDEGDNFGKPEEVCPKPEGVFMEGVSHLALDRKRDILYMNAGDRLTRIKGSGEMLPSMKFKDVTGTNKYNICEAAVGPEGNLYILAFKEYGYAKNFILRYDAEGKPLPLPSGGDNGVEVQHVMKGGSGGSTRGFTVDPKGNIYVMHYDDGCDKSAMPEWDRSWTLHTAVTKFNPDGSMANPRLIAHLRAGAQCVRTDAAGNVYVGDNILPLGVAYPRDFVGALPDPLQSLMPARMPDGSFNPVLRHMGTLLKFGPEGGAMIGLPEGTEATTTPRPDGDLWKPAPETQWFFYQNHKLKVTGAKWQYHGLSPIPAQYSGVTHVERCVCQAGRFDLDEFGRIFVPENMRSRITILDTEGNIVARFGQRDNADSDGPQIGLTNPSWVAAAADRVYIAEGSPGRIVKVKLDCAAEATCTVTR